MAKESANTNATERVGNIEMRVAFAEPTPESEARWARRAEALAAWLLAEWQREQSEHARESP